MNQDILHLSGLHTVLSGRTILHDISFTVDRGSVLSIIGPNGAGKSTLLRAILGILPSTGQITLDGTPLRSLTQRQIARKVAYVPQTVELVFPLTVGEFLKLSRYPHLSFAQVFGKHDEEIVRRAMELTHVTEFEERTLQSLSGGERQRVLVAAALAQEPGILLLDEVCHFLDPAHQREIQTLLRKLNTELGITILSVTHDINDALLNSTRVLALRSGTLVFDGSNMELATAENLKAIYDCDFVLTKHPLAATPIVIPSVIA